MLYVAGTFLISVQYHVYIYSTVVLDIIIILQVIFSHIISSHNHITRLLRQYLNSITSSELQ